MSEFPTYSDEAKFNLDEIFFQGVNDVNFYFEDENHESFYELLLERLFPKLKIQKVFCLGGKSEVLKKHKENTEASLANASVYILDKDYDDLLGIIKVHKNIIYLPRYCVENFLYDTNAFIGILIEEIKSARKRDLENELQLNKFYEYLILVLSKLTNLFVVAQKFKTGIGSTKIPHNEFLIGKLDSDFNVCEIWVKKYRTNLLTKIQHLKDEVDLDLELDRALLPHSTFKDFAEKTDDAHINGKHLIAITWEYISMKKGLKNHDPYLLSLKLLGKIEMHNFGFLKVAIESALNNPNSSS